MAQPSIGAMLHYIGGGSDKDPKDYYGKIVSSAEFSDDSLKITFDGGKKIMIHDDGQSCCENRYMRTDDDVNFLVGKKIITIEAKPAPDIADDGETHEVVFLEIMTDQGCITFSNHNEHNGYYGGFGLNIKEI